MRRIICCCFKKRRCFEFNPEEPNQVVVFKESGKNQEKSPTKTPEKIDIPTSSMIKSGSSSATNIILNHDFSMQLKSWNPNNCKGYVVSGNSDPLQQSANNYAVVTDRKESWQGLEQDITAKLFPNELYSVSALVGISGLPSGSSDVVATLKLEFQSETNYLFIGKASVSTGKWEEVKGTFKLPLIPNRVIFYLEGPPSGIDLLIQSVSVSSSSSKESMSTSQPGSRNIILGLGNENENIILNPSFSDGLNNWSGRGCTIDVRKSMGDGKIVPQIGDTFAVATARTGAWNGIQQDIAGRTQRKLAYEAAALVRIYGNNVSTAKVQATLWVQMPDNREQYIGIADIQATDNSWILLQGKFLISGSPNKVVIYLEGPPPGTDILVNIFTVKHALKPPPPSPVVVENPAYGINIVRNSDLSDGTNNWFPLGSCKLSVSTGSPRVLPTMARDSLGVDEPLSGRYILVTNRSATWMGPGQMITDKIKIFLTYQVSAWVKVTAQASDRQTVNLALNVDDKWVNGGDVEITDNRWHEVAGSFRLENKPSKVMVYVHGPTPGVDLMVAGVQIIPVDRHARFKLLKHRTEKIRKRDVTLHFTGAGASSLAGSVVKVKQTRSSFPFGSCINRENLDNEDFLDFFVKHFNWSVFGNELKWYWTEAQQGKYNYKDAGMMLDWCVKNNIEVRGHCIFWEVENAVQSWIKALNTEDLHAAVQKRLSDLLTRYKGKFRHYDVNNEMLHGSFYSDRLGKDIRAIMFKKANELDPSPILFVNDYHVEDGEDSKSYPQKYIEQVLGLQKEGAPVGGIGIQGHIDSPVGPIICSALDQLGILGLPIWITELDVSSTNEYIRADDLEVMMREAFAHPAVEGIVLWGFWELSMSRNDSHLVNAEGEINEAGKRYLQLRKEWQSHAHGVVDQQGEFSFRGFHGSYDLEIVSGCTKFTKTFTVDVGISPQFISIDLKSVNYK